MRFRKLVLLAFVLLLLIPAAATAAPIASTLLAGPCAAGGTYDPACDVNHDGIMDVQDVQLTAGRWGQTGTYVQNAAPPCWDNTNRFVDCGNGTVTDTVTGLIWLKEANCFGAQNYAAANSAAAGLQAGACGLADNSSPGDWRLPTSNEFQAILLSGCSTSPKLVGNGTPATGCYSDNPWATIVQANGWYWTSTTIVDAPGAALVADLGIGLMRNYLPKTDAYYVWPVRGGN